MIKSYGFMVLAVAFIPFAILLAILGITKIRQADNAGFWLKVAVLANTSLALALGFFGCKIPGGERTSCYEPLPVSDKTETPVEFQTSDDWDELERVMIKLEDGISSGKYNDSLANETGERVNASIEKLVQKNLITRDDGGILLAYCQSRIGYYVHMVGTATCYTPVPEPQGREATKTEIITTSEELRKLYEGYKIDTPAYETAKENLDAQLKVYTGKKDNAALRQLLLDLADGESGDYYDL
jgi:hypothetical protein